MNKILFVIPSFDIGGTNTSLINLLSNIDTTRYNCYVYAINNYGSLRNTIDKHATVINRQVIEQRSNNSFKGQKMSLAKSVFRFLRSIGIDLSPLYYRRIAQNFRKYGFEDIISFQEGNCTELVSYCNYTRRIAWVRSEYGRYLKSINKKPELNLYCKFDYIINVSETAASNFTKILPQLKPKTRAIYNLLDSERVLSLANECSKVPGDNFFTIISIGRVDPVKHFSEIPEISKKLKEKGLQFKWLIVGGQTENTPDEYNLISSLIKEYRLEETVFQLGHQTNPYTYLKQSDLLVCLSESETFNHTFAEARILGVPVLSVNYESSYEFLKQNEGGLIVSRIDIADTINRLVNNKSEYLILKECVNAFSFDNDKQLDRLYELL